MKKFRSIVFVMAIIMVFTDFILDAVKVYAVDGLVISDDEETIQIIEDIDTIDTVDIKEEVGADGTREEYVVNSIDELISKIGSNRTIILNDGIYKTSDTIYVSKYENGKYEDISDLTIQASRSGKVEILLDSPDAPVFILSACKNVTIQGLILGHDPVGDYSECGGDGGDVVRIENSDNITIEDCDLYGCGWSAVELRDAGTINVNNCILRDCTYNAIHYYTSPSWYRELEAYSLIMNLQITNCVISGNTKKEKLASYSYWFEYDKVALVEGDDQGQTGAKVTCHDCKICNNKSKLLVSGEMVNSVTFDSTCEFYNNIFDNESQENYGICVNGLTWQVKDSVLKIGYPINLDGNKVIDNAASEVLSYSDSSLPWKEVDYDYYDINNGIGYNESMFKGQKLIKEVKGDVTGDGDVAMDDVIKMAQAVEGSTILTENEKKAADVTGDGIVAMGDVVKVARFAAGSITEL